LDLRRQGREEPLMVRAVLALVAVVVTAGVLVATGTARQAATTVAVTQVDFKFKLSVKSVPHGTVTFRVTNKGKTRHDFKINGKKTALLAPGKSAVLKVTFRKAGRYPYLCTVPGHAQLGMKGVLVVK
jgi:uncharacterized cupredoxin-like copper-binding protein